MYKVTDEQSFLNAIKQRNLAGFSAFYDSCAPPFYGYIKRTLHEPKACDQTLEETFCTIWTSINEYDPAKERLFTWSFKIVRKKVSTKKIEMVLHEIFACQQIPSSEQKEKSSALNY
jgi:DNA-directed RNA polymerase specialized sigma24 family protein